MVLYITLKDIVSFYHKEKKVFIWLLICMICGSFVMNYSYSFARYRGEMYEKNSGKAMACYRIDCNAQTSSADGIISQLNESNLPEIKHFQLFTKSKNGNTIVGSSFISAYSSSFTGVWREGYASDIENTGANICAVNSNLLDYGDRLKMTGSMFDLDGEEFEVKGVFENSDTSTGVVIFADKFIKKYNNFNSLWITFSQRLSQSQSAEFERIVKLNIEGGSLTFPPEPGTIGADVVKSNELQYTAIVIMLMICLVSLIKYWQSVNLPTYTIYWINGATNGKIISVAMCESILLCGATYLVGLGLNVLFRPLLSRSVSLSPNDIFIGFGTFFGTFSIFTLINTAKICKRFSTANVRRD